MAHSPPSFSLLAKPSGAACNLACQYCFYLSKDRLYPGSHGRMPDKVLEAYINQLLAASGSGEVNVAWQGGEPTLMGLDFFKRSLELVKKYKKPGQHVSYSMQTNGTLLEEEWCKFFKQHNFLIGLSLDGPVEMHDAYRVNKAGKGSFTLVRHAWDILQEHQVDTNILCAVHAANASRPQEVYRYFRDDLGARFLQFIPIVEQITGDTRVSGVMNQKEFTNGMAPCSDQEMLPVSQRSVKPEQYGAFLVKIFDEWVQRDVGNVFIQTFEAALASWYRLPASVCIFQEVCGSSLVLEHNGDLYSCDHFVDTVHRLGNIMEKPMSELVGSGQQRKFGLDKRNLLPACCLKCDALFACHGECPRNRFMRSPEGQAGLNYLCPGYKQFFKHVDRPMKAMAELLRQGRSAVEIMQMV